MMYWTGFGMAIVVGIFFVGLSLAFLHQAIKPELSKSETEFLEK